MKSRKIIHIDMDCFYAAVEMRDRPDLREKPIAVGGSPEGRGVIATANYLARKSGVRSAMASATALRLCPDLVIVRPNFFKYKTESQRAREIFSRFTTQIEPLSLDEAYLDVSQSTAFNGSATLIAEEIRRLIRSELGLTASAGVAPNKFLAKIASDINKPDGIKVVRPQDVDAFVKLLPIEKIWGVGRVTAEKMHSRGIRTFQDLQNHSIVELTQFFGSWGAQLYDFARGVDEREVKEDRVRKSVSVEETFSIDLVSQEQCLQSLGELFDDLCERMIRADCLERVRGLTVKLKFHDFKSMTHDRSFRGQPAIGDFRSLFIEAYERRSDPLRLIGIGVRLESAQASDGAKGGQLAMF